MLRKILLAFGLLLIASPALAQNTTCSDRPATDSSNACANTRFVQKAISNIPPTPPGGTNGQIQYNNNGAFGGFTANGDVTINTSTGATVANNIRGVPVITTGSAVNDILAYNGTSYIHTAFASLVNTMCSLSPTTCVSLFGYGYAPWWGAVCDNSADDTAAIIAAIAALPSGSTLVFPSTVCKVATITSGGNPHSITVNKPLHISFPNGGGINHTVNAILFDLQSDNITISGASGATLNGTYSGSTIYSTWAVAIATNNYDTSTTARSNIQIYGLKITNFSAIGMMIRYCYYCDIHDNYVENVAYAGIQCVACTYGTITNNIVRNVWSSTGPSIPPDPPTRADHYGIAVTSDGIAFISQNMVVSNNVVSNVPAWECYDTHTGQNIVFSNNIGEYCRVGISVSTPAAPSTTVVGIVISNNRIRCIPLGSPIYSGGPSTSVGGQGINVSGYDQTRPASSIIINGNTISECGADDTSLVGTVGSIFIRDTVGFTITNNLIYDGRYRGIYFGGTVNYGSAQNNGIYQLVAGPAAAGAYLIDIQSPKSILNLGGLHSTGSGYYGYNIVAQDPSFSVSISRTNVLDNATALYVGSSASNRIDLGLTAP